MKTLLLAIFACLPIAAGPVTFLDFTASATSATSTEVWNANPQDIWIVADDPNQADPEQLVITLFFSCPLYDDLRGAGGIVSMGSDSCDHMRGEQQYFLPITWGVPTEMRFPLTAYAQLASVTGTLVIGAGSGSWQNPAGDGTVTLVDRAAVPEPGTWWLVVAILGGLAAGRWLRRMAREGRRRPA